MRTFAPSNSLYMLEPFNKISKRRKAPSLEVFRLDVLTQLLYLIRINYLLRLGDLEMLV